MKRIKVLIIEDQSETAKAVARSIEELLYFLGVNVDFVYAYEYEDARLKVLSADYDIISLDGMLMDLTPGFPLINTILNLHPKAVVFFLSSSTVARRLARERGIELTLLKGVAPIISNEDLLRIKKALVEKEIISYEVLYGELINAVLIFSETKTDLLDFDKTDGAECLLVAKILNSKEINYSMIDRGATMKIFVDKQSVQITGELAKGSNLKFWSDWSNKFFK